MMFFPRPFVALLLAPCFAFLPFSHPRSRGTALSAISVALTREEGKNAKLQKALEASSLLSLSGVQALELSCIAHADGSDYDSLSDTLLNGSWDYVAVTSPEAARVVASAWDVVRDNPPPVAAVGKATQETLTSFGINVCFCPSKATAATLVKELPGEEGCKLLYPASQRAKQTLESGLKERGFQVTRLNTYDTVTAVWQQDTKLQASSCQVACFASPSAVKGWLSNTENNNQVIAACIGETSATACRENGWTNDKIFYPEKPGIEGWVEAVEQAVESLQATHAA
jgi:uroporphyrinogen-III synthase